MITHPRTTVNGPTSYLAVKTLARPRPPRRITPLRPIASVAWAPRGDWIAYQAQPRKRTQAPVVRIVRSDGKGVAMLPAAAGPAWSPVARQLAYLRTPAGSPVSTLWLANRDGKRRRPLVRAPVSQPAWSPAGGTVAFVEGGGGDDAQVQTVRARGGSPRDATHVPETYVIERFWWARKGGAIFYTARRVLLPD